MIRWITDSLGTVSYYDYQETSVPTTLIDVRELIDREGNTNTLLAAKIQEAYQALQAGQRVVVSCDKGISRSNAIALGVLVTSGMSYEEALTCLVAKVDIADINLGLLHDIQALIHQPSAPSKTGVNILITGASGFIGRVLSNSLSSEYKVFSPTRAELDLIYHPCFLDAYINQNRIDTVLHLAHPQTRNNVSSMAETIAMTRNILEVCRLNRTGLFYLSCLAIFSGYRSSKILKANSQSAPCPKGVYAETKFLCEALIKSYQQVYDLDGIILRPSLLYGVQLDRAIFISKFFEAASQGRPIRTHHYKNGLPVFDFLYLDDLIEAIRLSLKIKPKLPLSIGTGRAISTYELAQLVVKTCQSKSEVDTFDIEEETYKVVADPSEAVQHLGWYPKVDLEQGLQNVWRNYYKALYLQ